MMLIFISLCLVAAAAADFSTESDMLWTEFRTTYQKSYDSKAEEFYR